MRWPLALQGHRQAFSTQACPRTCPSTRAYRLRLRTCLSTRAFRLACRPICLCTQACRPCLSTPACRRGRRQTCPYRQAWRRHQRGRARGQGARRRTCPSTQVLRRVACSDRPAHRRDPCALAWHAACAPWRYHRGLARWRPRHPDGWAAAGWCRGRGADAVRGAHRCHAAYTPFYRDAGRDR